MLNFIVGPLDLLLDVCYGFSYHYAGAIVLFTALTKVIVFPVSLWMQRNSIKMVELIPELNRLKIKYYGDRNTIAEETQALYQRIGYHPLASTIPMFIQLVLLVGVIGAVRELLAGTESMLSVYPSQQGGITLLMPFAAGLAALLLGLAQNRLNPLQREQTKASQWATNGFSIAISIALGAFVPVGVGVYWIASNLFTIVQQMACNAVMPAKRYVDYEALEKSRQELAGINDLSSNISKEDKRREKADYKRFFSVANKHLVFYSESSGFYKYYQTVIEYLLSHSNVIIHYVTSDPKDRIFELAKTQSHIRPYYIGEKRLITLMMKMDADIVVMTMPDLENYHIKRSYVRKDIEYISLPHGISSDNLTLRRNALAHYDTLFAWGAYNIEEHKALEKLNGTREKRYVEWGYGLLDNLIDAYAAMPKVEHTQKVILIAPSWQKDNLMDLCVEGMLDQLLGRGYRIIVRPHPQYMRHFESRINGLMERYKQWLDSELSFEKDFSSNESIYTADLVVTDWSNIACEYAFATLKPVLFIDTPMKTMNPDYQKLGIVPFDVEMRNLVGRSVSTDALEQLPGVVEDLIGNQKQYIEKIREIRERQLFSIGHSGEVGGKYILTRLKEKAKGVSK